MYARIPLNGMFLKYQGIDKLSILKSSNFARHKQNEMGLQSHTDTHMETAKNLSFTLISLQNDDTCQCIN